MKNQKKTKSKSLIPITRKLEQFNTKVARHAVKADELEQDIARMQEKLAAHNAAIELLTMVRVEYLKGVCAKHQAYGFETPLSMQFALDNLDVC